MNEILSAIESYQNQWCNTIHFSHEVISKALKVPPNEKYYRFITGTHRADHCVANNRVFETKVWEESAFDSKAEAEGEIQKMRITYDKHKTFYKNILKIEEDVLQYEFGPVTAYSRWRMNLPNDREILKVVFGNDFEDNLPTDISKPEYNMRLKVNQEYVCAKILKDAGIEIIEGEVRRKDVNNFLG